MNKLFRISLLWICLGALSNVAAFQGGKRDPTPSTPVPPSTSPSTKTPRRRIPVVKRSVPSDPKNADDVSKTANIAIKVTPTDSVVWLNDQQISDLSSDGSLSLTSLKPGSYVLTVRHSGYRDLLRHIELKANNNDLIEINLEPLKGTLNIRPSVDGTSIELRSVDRNQNVGSYAGAINQIEFPPGEYEITISKPGYATATRTVTLKAGATVELEPRLDPLPPPKPAPKPRPRPMSARVETDGKYLIVHLSGTSEDDSTTLGSINVSAGKSSLASPEVSGTLNGSPCRIEFFKIENIDKGSLMETPGPSNQYSVIIVRIRPKDSKRPVRFAINWKSIGSASQSPQTVSTSDTLSEAVPTHKVLPTIPTLARSSQTQGSVNVAVVIDEQGNVISAKAIDGPVVLRQAAENAARQWKFRPAMRNGTAIQTTQTIRFNFEK